MKIVRIGEAVLIGGLTLVACKGSSVVDSLEGKDAATAVVEDSGVAIEAGGGGAGGAASGGGAAGGSAAGGEAGGGAGADGTGAGAAGNDGTGAAGADGGSSAGGGAAGADGGSGGAAGGTTGAGTAAGGDGAGGTKPADPNAAQPGAPAGVVEFLAIHCAGGTTDAVLRTALDKAKTRYRGCYGKAFAGDPSTQGTLKLRATIATDGVVEKVDVIGGNLGLSPLVQCSVATTKSLKIAGAAAPATKATFDVKFSK